jgi:hypothetical protein
MNSNLAFQEETQQGYIPQLLGWFKKEKEDAFLDRSIADWENRGVIRYPIWIFFSDKLDVEFTRLISKKPIQIEVRRGEELIFVESANLRIYAAGDTKDEAFKEFSIQLIYQYEHYIKTPNEKLVGEALKMKKVFEELFDRE